MLCPVVEGVLFTVHRASRQVRAVVLRDVLESEFGATADPSSWLSTYQAHAEEIDRAVWQRHIREPTRRLVVLGPTELSS